MKRLLWSVAGFCAAAAGLLVWKSKLTPSVNDISREQQDSWVDDHTAA
jgi:hypothetical protein